MPPPLIAPVLTQRPHTQRLIRTIITAASPFLPHLFFPRQEDPTKHAFFKRAEQAEGKDLIIYACLIPVLVLLSGLFAGLTLGYMSLDETQLHVLSVSGTPEQQKYAKKIIPVRKNGHLLLVSLLLVNMIVNESLPIIADPVLGGGIKAVAVSTVLIIIFAEIIPQSLFTRNGLYLGAKMAPLTHCLIYAVGIISWPIAKLLEFSLGPHHGIMYRRTELKELIAMHSHEATHGTGGDLNKDTVNIVRSTLDLQEKVVTQAMTPIDKVFMLSLEHCKLDYKTLKEIVATGHSRIPVYEEIAVPHGFESDFDVGETTHKAKRIVGILLVKQCVLLDPKDEVPLRNIPLNKVPFVPSNESLLGILDKFQEGRSHMAFVSRFAVSEEKAETVKKATKKGLTQRFKVRVGISDSSESDEEDVEMGKAKEVALPGSGGRVSTSKGSFMGSSGLEQAMPADAVLAKEGVKSYLQSFDHRIMPVGIITLEDVLEELIGEEIYDEYDTEGDGKIVAYERESSLPIPVSATTTAPVVTLVASELQRPTLASRAPSGILGFIRSKSVPPTSRTSSAIGPMKEKEKQTTLPANATTMTPAATPPPAQIPVETSALGAVFFERKRRGTSRPTTPVPKGRGFKSTPLTGGAPTVGVVGAENGETMPDESEKVAPDKEV